MPHILGCRKGTEFKNRIKAKPEVLSHKLLLATYEVRSIGGTLGMLAALFANGSLGN